MYITLKIQVSQTLDSTFLQHCVSPTQSSWTGRMSVTHLRYVMANPRNRRTPLWGVGYMRHLPCWCLGFWKEKNFIHKILGLFPLPDVDWEAAFSCLCGSSVSETHVIWSRPINILHPVAFMWAAWAGEKSPEEHQWEKSIPLYVVMEEKTGKWMIFHLSRWLLCFFLALCYTQNKLQ